MGKYDATEVNNRHAAQKAAAGTVATPGTVPVSDLPEEVQQDSRAVGQVIGRTQKRYKTSEATATSFREKVAGRQAVVDHDATSKAMGGQAEIPGQPSATEREKQRKVTSRKKPAGMQR